MYSINLYTALYTYVYVFTGSLGCDHPAKLSPSFVPFRSALEIFSIVLRNIRVLLYRLKYNNKNQFINYTIYNIYYITNSKIKEYKY